MSTQDESKPMQMPAFFIYDQDEEGNSLRIGAVFRHKRGPGFNILLDGKRYLAFPPKVKTEASGESA